MFRFILILTLLVAFRHGDSKIIISKNIPYVVGSKDIRQQLDVYSSSRSTSKCPVLIFIHGGSWNSGKKDTYKFFGKGFAKKGVVTVILNYRLSPKADYRDMADDCAAALKWVTENISNYGGDPTRIFISGHSAGGHLAALVVNDTSFLSSKGIANCIKGGILIDAFGLDMHSYLRSSDWKGDSTFKITFTQRPEIWKKGSPINHLTSSSVPQLVWVGGKTYSSISEQGQQYSSQLNQLGVYSEYSVIRKKHHIGMILQFIRPSNKLYEKAVVFMGRED